MKRLIMLIVLIQIVLLENIYSTKMKQPQKTFDKIFGDNWEKENAQIDGQITQRAKEILERQFKEIFDESWNGEEMGEEEEEDNSSQKSEKKEENVIGKSGQLSKETTDQQKKEMIQKFDQMKNKYQERREYSRKERYNIEAKIVSELGISGNKMRQWKKQFGKKKISNGEKREKIEKYLKLKKDFKANGKHSQKEWQKFKNDLCTVIGYCHDSIRKWMKEFGMIKGYRRIKNPIKKKEQISKYDEIKQKYKQKGRHTVEEWHNFERKITKKLGTSTETILRWKKQLEQKK